MRREKNSEFKFTVSKSCLIGIIALVFLVIGYQAALFVHRAAVMTIEAKRDSPDTVYIYMLQKAVNCQKAYQNRQQQQGSTILPHALPLTPTRLLSKEEMQNIARELRLSGGARQ